VHLLALRRCDIPEEFILSEHLAVYSTCTLKLCINASLRRNECKFKSHIMTGVRHITFLKICQCDKKKSLFTPQAKWLWNCTEANETYIWWYCIL